MDPQAQQVIAWAISGCISFGTLATILFKLFRPAKESGESIPKLEQIVENLRQLVEELRIDFATEKAEKAAISEKLKKAEETLCEMKDTMAEQNEKLERLHTQNKYFRDIWIPFIKDFLQNGEVMLKMNPEVFQKMREA